MMKKLCQLIPFLLFGIVVISIATSCSDDESYAQLLDDENKAVNAFLADQRVIGQIPADTVFEYGENAPYYKMDSDGNIYMQVINPGNREENKAENNELIYFRYMRYDLFYYSNGEFIMAGDGNAEDLDYIYTSFRFENYTLSSSSQWGSGIQLPLYYLGIDCEVNLVIKSQYGVTDEISYVIPYLYNIRYFKNQL